MPCVDAYMACLEKVLNEKPKNLEKARLQAFLASRPEKALWIGAAARAGYWAWNDPPFAGVKAFLSGL
jgi:hypothetical protein